MGLSLLLCAGAARAADAADGGVTDGGGPCALTNQCAVPFPYCDPALQVCVECLDDGNCKGRGVCDRTRGRCTECTDDGDCDVGKPYCDRGRGVCAQCLSDGNCAGFASRPRCDTATATCVRCLGSADCPAGSTCQQSECTTCGDGICQQGELVYSDPFSPESRAKECFEDCQRECLQLDLGSQLGTFSTYSEGSHWELAGCAERTRGVDASFRWTAPRAGRFSFDASKSGFSTVALGHAVTDCLQAINAMSSDCYFSTRKVTFNFAEGQSLLLILDTSDTTPGRFELTIRADEPPCDRPSCMPVAGDAGTAETRCLEAAAQRGEELCGAAECACRNCPRDYDDCAVVPSCRTVFDCMKDSGCIGTECYAGGACRDLIDSLGGISGPAFAAASRLQTCDGIYACSLPCPSEGAGLCAPGREVECACEGGSGTKRCSADGKSFGSCSCDKAAAAPPASSDCGCRAPAQQRSASALALALVLGVLATLHRRAARRRPLEAP